MRSIRMGAYNSREGACNIESYEVMEPVGNSRGALKCRGTTWGYIIARYGVRKLADNVMGFTISMYGMGGAGRGQCSGSIYVYGVMESNGHVYGGM